MRFTLRHSIALAVVVFACRPTSPRSTNTSIAGDVFLVAPVVGAAVKVSLLNDAAPEVVGNGVTDENGHFDIELFASEGTLLIEVTGEQGGTTKEPVSGKLLQLSLSDRFTNLMAKVNLGDRYEGIIVSPWSTLVSARAMWDVKTNGTSVEKALALSAQLFIDHFAGLAFFSAPPLDPAAAATNGLSTGAIHGFATSALAVMGADLSRRLRLSEGNLINTISLTQWLADDVGADGQFDGHGKAGVMNMIDEQNVDVEFTRAFLGAALGTFITSDKNLSGVGLADLRGVINAITLDTSALYGSALSVAVSEGLGPRITVSSPMASSKLKDQVLIFGKAESESGVAGVEISLDGKNIGGGERESVNVVSWARSVPLTDGFHILKVTARDSSGATSDLPITFQSDATAPTVKQAFCKAFDDLARVYRPAVGQDEKIRWNAAASPDASCGVDRLQPKTNPNLFTFRTYAELAKAASTSSYVAFVPEDNGQVFTAQSALLMEASIYRDGAQIGHTARVDPGQHGESTRPVALSSELFGGELLDVSADETLELRIAVSDDQGNESSSSIYFHLDLLASPLFINEATPPTTSSERIEHYTFDAGNVAQAFDPSLFLPARGFVSRRYSVKNISDRDIALKLSLNAGAALTGTVTQWQGFFAGARRDGDFDSKYDHKNTSGELVTPGFSSHWSSCFNDAGATQITEASIPTNPNVLAVTNGATSCIRAEDILGAGVKESANGTWLVAVQNGAGDSVFPFAGEYVIAAGSTYYVTLGFTQPAFPARTVNACTPTYAKGYIDWDYFPRADTFARTALNFLPGGFMAQPRTVYEAAWNAGVTAWSERAYMDCRGFQCDGDDCRKDSNQFTVRVQAQPIVHDSHLTDGTWWRQVDRPFTEFSLSRVFYVNGVNITGHGEYSSTAHLTTNTAKHDELFDLPIEAQTVNYSTRSSISPPNNGVRYTKGSLP